MPIAPRLRRRGGLLAAAALALVLLAPAAHADDYVIGPEDVLQVSVWLHPELERSVTVGQDGNVTLPPVGQIKAAGLTAQQLSGKIADRLSAYLRQTATVTVTVSQYMSLSVYVQGAVAKPGRYGFERIPSLLDVLGAAGGAVPGADLGSVQVLRREGDAHRTLTADLATALRTGDTTQLPELKPGDMIVIPGTGNAIPSASSEGVGVLGEVNKPGVYTLVGTQDLWAVLASAGGLTARAKLSDVRVLTHTDAGQSVASVDLKDVLAHGSRVPVSVKAGDVVVVMSRGASVWEGLVGLLSLSRDALNVAVLLDYLKHNRIQ